MDLILASQSPRRHQILAQLGYEFKIISSGVDEDTIKSEDQLLLPETLAIAKAVDVSKKHPSQMVLGYDTLVFLQNQVLGKPQSSEEAISLLEQLSANVHIVRTGFCLAQNGKVLSSETEETKVYFRQISREEIIRYVNSGSPMDKAGAYGIQDQGARFVKRIEGCYYNVAGLPIAKTIETLNKYSEE
jgi:septum formation protein